MKKFVLTVFLIFSIGMMSVVSWWFAIKPEVEGNANFDYSGSGVKYVTVPLGGREYVNIPIDGINTEVGETNHLTVWQFNDARIMRTSNPVSGNTLSGGVQYSSNKQVFKQFGDFYVTVTSPNKYVGESADGLVTAESYIAPCPEMTEENQIDSLPSTQLPQEYNEENGWKLPMDVEELTLGQSSDDMSYYKGNWYFNYNFRYMKMDDAVADAATRVCALSHKGLDWWYMNGNVFVAKSGNEYACVLQRDYTSCYFISSNDLSYIELNIQ